MTSAEETPSTRMNSRVLGLDSIRFVLALWVMVGHFGRLPFAERLEGTAISDLVVRGIYNNLVSGPAAVIVFFVVSGFCIHFPYRSWTRITLLPYFARRHVRILLPVIVALVWAWTLGMRLPAFNHSILWSLLCEEIYYTLYPVLLQMRARIGWRRMIFAAFVVSVAVVLTNPRAGDYPSYGPGLNWLLGFPCWLLGCDLAERWDSFALRPGPGRLAIWAWRLTALFASMTCSALRFHSPLTYPWTLNVFGVLAVLWLEREILYFRDRKPVKWLEIGGVFSYSIYLVHMHAVTLFYRMRASQGHALLDWSTRVLFVLAVCYAFYRVVERPSHRLARMLHKRLSVRRATAQSADLEAGH